MVFLWFSYGSSDPSHVTSTTRPGPREFRHDGDASTHGSHGEGETFRGRGAVDGWRSGVLLWGKWRFFHGKTIGKPWENGGFHGKTIGK